MREATEVDIRTLETAADDESFAEVEARTVCKTIVTY
jgi:hypothetical protein